MKYIRTKDGIYKSSEYLLSNEDLRSIAVCKDLGINPYKDVKIADTIEEVCDEFVYIGLDYPKVLDTYHDFGQIDINQVLFNRTLHKDSCLYGAIWTDKGLIYVAKMNDKGELELL